MAKGCAETGEWACENVAEPSCWLLHRPPRGLQLPLLQLGSQCWGPPHQSQWLRTQPWTHLYLQCSASSHCRCPSPSGSVPRLALPPNWPHLLQPNRGCIAAQLHPGGAGGSCCHFDPGPCPVHGQLCCHRVPCPHARLAPLHKNLSTRMCRRPSRGPPQQRLFWDQPAIGAQRWQRCG